MKYLYPHAIVIGGSIAGMTTARVLTDYCERVTIIERDVASTAKEFRKGVPQARHAHIILKGGEQVLEGLFPGLRQELLTQGAHSLNVGSDFDWFMLGQWRKKFSSSIVTTACSRPLLEAAIRVYLSHHPRVALMQEREVIGLMLDETKTRVAGVRFRARHGVPTVADLPAALVVDASGRDSEAPHWLHELGFPTPLESNVTSKPGYATRLYEVPASFDGGWKGLYMQPSALDHKRGVFVAPLEGKRWQITLIGMAGDYPPSTEDEFLEFTRSLPDQRLYELLKESKPISDIWGFRRGENRLRHYEKLSRYIEGFMVCGDAVYALNPVYGQGMTVAAIGSLALGECLRNQQKKYPDGNLNGLAQTFQKRLATVIAGPWQLATGEDRRWNVDENLVPADFPTRMMQSYIGKLLYIALTDTDVAEAFAHVQQMLKPPTSLFRLDIFWKVLTRRGPA
jgi:2-polyprenyl-6-methoxyphenol hydroxylase-like FAD-dependent oxidoreductase